MAIDGDIEIASSEPILKEAIGVLRGKFEWDGRRLHTEYERLRAITKIVSPTRTINVIEHDLPYNRILECAEAAKVDCICTEDKDLLRLGEYEGARIVKVAEMLETVQGKGG
jgi:predicted nucleic acid-binding protein